MADNLPVNLTRCLLDSFSLSVINLACVRNNLQLFEKLNFDLHSGEVLLIEGSNGSGKTSLLRLLAGLAAPEQGDIFWQGQNLSSARYEYSQSISYIGHTPGIKMGLSADENLNWLAPGFGRKQRCHALTQAGLAGHEAVPCARLSAGQQRRVSLARLYLEATPLWILDEPFTAQDKTSVKSLETLLVNHSLRGGMVILTSHQDLVLNDVPLRSLMLKDFVPQAEPLSNLRLSAEVE